MRFILDNWPDFLAVALSLAGGWLVMFLPLNIWLRIALVPVGAAGGFAVWFAVCALLIWFIWSRPRFFRRS